MEDRNIPYIAFESAQARFDRIHARDHFVIVLLVILLFGTNLAWVIYEHQWQYVDSTTVTQEMDTDSDNGSVSLNMVGGDYYGN